MVGDVDGFVFGATVELGIRTVQRLAATGRRITTVVPSDVQESVTFGRPDRRDGWIAEETEPALRPRPPRYATPRAGWSAEPAGCAL